MAKRKSTHSEVDRLQIAGVTWNFAPFGLIFTAKKFLEAGKVVAAHEGQPTSEGWHPVGKYLACHSIELSLKAFLTFKGERLLGAKGFGHHLSNLLEESDKRGLSSMVILTAEDRNEILKATLYYNEKVFEYPSLIEATRAYPADPATSYLVAAAQKLVDGLYKPCQEAA